jgi:hypothetical protein
MPFTPFHFGPGALIKACAPRHVSFAVFAFTQVLIDVEPLYFMLRGEYPVHRFLHSYLGATLVVLPAFFLGRPIAGVALALFRARLKPTIASVSEAFRSIPRIAALMGAVTGAYSHVLLDSIMHTDVHPFAPISENNPLLLTISILELHVYCAVAGLLGSVGLGFWWLVSKERA